MVGVMKEVVVGVMGLVLALGCLVLGCCDDACLVLLFDYSAFSDVFVCVLGIQYSIWLFTVALLLGCSNTRV